MSYQAWIHLVDKRLSIKVSYQISRVPLRPLLKKYEEKSNKQAKDVVVKIKRKITDCRLNSTKSDDGNNNSSSRSRSSNNNNNNNSSNKKQTKQHISQKQIKD